MDDWQNKTRSLPDRAQYTLSKKLFSDCEFIIDKEKVKCHKLILAMGSPVFQAMFFGSNAEPSGPVEIKDIGLIAFKQIIEFIYGRSVDFSSFRNACDIYYGGKKYLLYFLERDCVEYLKNNLTNDNVLYIYEFAKFHNEEELQKQCIMEIQLKTEDIFDENNLFEISEETLESILDLNLLNVSSELYLFKAVEKWIISNKTDMSSELHRDMCFRLYKKLRLLTLSVEEFAEGPANSKFLSDSEKLTILLRITGAVQLPLNNGLCELTNKRKHANIKCMSILDITVIANS